MAQDTIGTLVAARRSNMEMSLNALVQRMGGSPSASFLNRIETGKVTPTRRVAGRLADALSLPRDLVLNAAGHASEGQEGDALDQLRAMLGERAPVMVAVTVMDPKTAKATGERRQRMLRTRYDARLVDLDGEDNEPFAGEVVYDPDDEIRRGVGVVRLEPIDWSQGPRELNLFLRTIWAHVQLDERLRPMFAAWSLPEWRQAA